MIALVVTLCAGPLCREVDVPVQSCLGAAIEAQAAVATHLRPGEQVARIACKMGERA